jgi:hypothetical protein
VNVIRQLPETELQVPARSPESRCTRQPERPLHRDDIRGRDQHGRNTAHPVDEVGPKLAAVVRFD